MEQMRLEIEAAGHDVQFVAINKADAVDDQAKLTVRCSYPLLQDVEEVDVWGVHHQGHKDDFYIYDRDGKLVDYLPVNGDAEGKRPVNLSTPDGYKTLKTAIVDVVEAQ